MEVDKGEIILFSFIAISAVLISYAVFTSIVDYHVEGIITDKFITSDINGSPLYYFILNNSSDIRVNIDVYYKYNVGDFYKTL